MQTLHIVSHTHWDREWYKTFQQFRLQLVHLVDNLLTILENDPSYQHFMLDGQTIVLEDYLQVRMANLPLLQKYIQENRILIGPWYILPDEFLVSPEAIIRNLLVGSQISKLFGQRMMIGYLPDPFGHIAQMPQILNGFHMDTACLWRGVLKEYPTVFHWEAPDGSRVLLAHLPFGYGNIAYWPCADPQQSLVDLDQAADKLAPLNPTSHFLMMRGTDHLEPRPTLPEHIRYYNQHQASDRKAIHSTLPAYLAAVSDQIENEQIQLPTLVGELRDPQKAHILPGVLSARMWIKQRNRYAETMLERWVEPFSTWAELLKRGDEAFLPIREVEKTSRINDPGPIIQHAWKLLLSNHPHDSICGCSIDETHNDMISRFDQVDQIAEVITEQSLTAILSEIDTKEQNKSNAQMAVTVFNASPYSSSDLVSVSVEMPFENAKPSIYDQNGEELDCVYSWEERKLKESNTYPISKLMSLLPSGGTREHNQQTLIRASLSQDADMPAINAEFSDTLQADEANLSSFFKEVEALVANNDPNTLVRIKVFNVPSIRVSFIAKDVPALGYKNWWLGFSPLGIEEGLSEPEETDDADEELEFIENEFFRLTVEDLNGSLTLFDKRYQVEYPGLNAFVDRGDRGDEYNYTPPENDQAFTPILESVETIKTDIAEIMILQMDLELPIGLCSERDNRCDEYVSCPLDVTVALNKGVPEVSFQVVFDNQALDHRLEVRFPTGLKVDHATYDGHFQTIQRPIDLPEHDASWREQPRPEVPQRAFADVSTPERGLMLANLGLPEVATLREADGSATIALTLLRCVGWLSRDDMWNRRGQAGPPLPTPGAQEQAAYIYDYSLIPHGPDFNASMQQAQSFQSSLIPFARAIQTGKLPSTKAMVEISNPNFMITALKEAENEAGWILRGVNLANETIHLSLKPNLPYLSASLVNLDESHLLDLEMSDEGTIELPVAAHKIVSFFFRIVE